MAKKKNARIDQVLIYCPEKDEVFDYDYDDLYFYGSEQECDMCGSHGEQAVSVSCRCGQNHEIVLRSW